jgi:hypothetical protein
MDIEFFLKLRTAFIRYFYETSVKPFDAIKSAIEKGEAPYIPPYSEDEGPPFLEEWMNAEQGIDAIGHACISMLSSSLQLFLKSWVDRLVKEHGMKFDADFKKRGWFNGYKQIFVQLQLPLSECTVDCDVIEQVTLARNRVQHPEELTALWVKHSESDLKRFPKPFFASEAELKMAIRDDDDSVIWWLRPSVKSAQEKILAAIDQVESLCSWLEAEYWKAVHNHRLQRIVANSGHSR